MSDRKVRATATQLQNKPKTISTVKKTKPQTSLSGSTKKSLQILDDGQTKTKKLSDDRSANKSSFQANLTYAAARDTKKLNSLAMPTQSVRSRNQTKAISSKNVKEISLKQKSQPLRAKHSSEIVETIKKNSETLKERSLKNPEPKTNAVLDTVHNVTVLSPPIRRKIAPVKPSDKNFLTRSPPRPRTRILDEEEVVVLRRDSAKKRLEENIKKDEQKTTSKTPIKDPIAFEVKFEEPISPQPKTLNVSKEDTPNTEANDEQSYSDDFESYESDFESASSSQNGSSDESDKSQETTKSENEGLEVNSSFGNASDLKDTKSQLEVDKTIAVEEEEDEESFITQCPVTVIQKDKDLERKLDSGNYEINSRRHKLSEISMNSSQTMISSQFDSLETFSTANSEQLDSGISGYDNSVITKEYEKSNCQYFYEGYVKFVTSPVSTERGLKIMSKIQFDMLTFTLFEMRPLTYDIFMQTYGKLHTTQSYTQTNDNRMSSECQTDEVEERSKWTQHPPNYDVKTIKEMGTNLSSIHNACGEEDNFSANSKILPFDELDASALQLKELVNRDNKVLTQFRERYQKPLNLEKLNTFLRKSSELMSSVLHSIDKQKKKARDNKEDLGIQDSSILNNGFFTLDTKFLNSLQVIRVFANAAYDIVVTVHESLPDVDVYRSDFSNLLIVWSTRRNESKRPIRLLSTWSKICRVEICHNFSEIIVASLVDGSLAMWDLRETYSFCSKLDGYLTHFTATQSIVPAWFKTNKLTDLGAMIDVRSFKSHMNTVHISNSATGYKSVQIATLNESGILTIWTLVETKSQMNTPKSHEKYKVSMGSQLEYSSPWARVKLIQSTISNIREYIECNIFKKQSQFEKTLEIFQKEIYNDNALKELLNNKSENQERSLGLRFTSMETGSEVIYVCTNQNFILACSKSLKTERFRKITINESSLLFPTSLCVLSNEDFLAVGFSNGSVSIINTNPRKFQHQFQTQSRPSTTFSNRPATQTNIRSFTAENGKSCAIQNLILNERRSFEDDENILTSQQDYRPDTAACMTMLTNKKKPYELRVYDQQVLLGGNTLRTNLVRSLALSSDGWRLFVLTNENVRVYDFFLDNEIPHTGHEKVIDIGTAKTRSDELHLVVLTAENEVNLHNIRQ